MEDKLFDELFNWGTVKYICGDNETTILFPDGDGCLLFIDDVDNIE